MGSFIDNVDNCKLNVQGLHTEVLFATPSDALFAAFFVKYAKAAMEFFDDMFSLFQHPAFESNRLTVRSSEDLLDYISSQRSLKTRSRLTGWTKGYDRSMPLLVVGLVADYLDSERTPFHHVISHRDHHCESDWTLRSMALVHRSWTDAAQRALRRRIVTKGRESMRLLLQSPHLGLWVRDLSIRVSEQNTDAMSLDLNARDAPRLMSRILSRCPNVTNLYLEDPLQIDRDYYLLTSWPPPTVSTAPTSNVVRDVGDLHRLEHLWVKQNFRTASWQLHAIPHILHQLRRLKSLEISHRPLHPARLNEEDLVKLQTHLATAGLKPALERLSLQSIRSKLALGWLLDYSQSYKPNTLRLSFSDTRYTQPGKFLEWDPRPFLHQVGPHVTKLMLTDFTVGDRILDMTKHFPVLRVLCICVDDRVELPFIPFPGSLQRLHIHFAKTNTGEDESLASSLRDSPHIREVDITYDSSLLESYLSGPPFFDATSAICMANGVSCTLRGRVGIPSYLDL